MLATSHTWQFDAFRLSEATDGHPLSTLGFYLMHGADLIGKFNIKPHLLARWVGGVGWVGRGGGGSGHPCSLLQHEFCVRGELI